MNCGLLGRSLSHSYSPQIHACLGDYAYALFEKEPEELEEFLRHGEFSGINVTIPYKKAVIPYLDDLTPAARALGAVNTVVRRADGSLLGHNTDFFGFQSLLQRSGVDVSGKKCLVLGSGGASSTAAAVLREAGAETIVISRSGEHNYGNLSRHSDAALIVNTTPLGMYPQTGVTPVAVKDFPHLECVLDVVYNPARTQLLLEAEALDIPCHNGLWMLVAQAWEASSWFQGASLSPGLIGRIYSRLSRQMENIILIGMPGCGKSTVGQLLAERLGREFADADRLIEEAAGTSIPEIFAAEGEAGFRLRETQALSRLGKQSGLVIATGGGCVTRPENYPLLHQNGRLFWLQREIGALPTQGRPLSRSGNLDSMYAQRKLLYAAFADHILDNNGDPEHAVSEICRIWEEMP